MSKKDIASIVLSLVATVIGLVGFAFFFGPFINGPGGSSLVTGFRLALDFRKEYVASDGNITGLCIAMILIVIGVIRSLGDAITHYFTLKGRINPPNAPQNDDEKKTFLVAGMATYLIRALSGAAIFFCHAMAKVPNSEIAPCAILAGVFTIVSAIIGFIATYIRYKVPGKPQKVV